MECGQKSIKVKNRVGQISTRNVPTFFKITYLSNKHHTQRCLPALFTIEEL